VTGVVLALSGLSVSVADEGPDAKAGNDSPMVVDYTGKLQDEEAKPVSGVFHLEFKLYDGERAAKATWSERQYVAIVDGAYTVPLGSGSTLEPSAIPEEAWIGVDLVGEGQLIRDRFQIDDSKPAAASKGDSSGDSMQVSAETRKLLEDARGNKQVTFADVAERAVTADNAEVAKRANQLGDLTAEEFEKKTQVALDRLGEHITDPDAHSATGGLRLSNERAVQERVGGGGGRSYQVNCPPGHVVTGIKGGAGRLVDSIRLICQKLR
jgi:hypothetical protein